MDRNELIRNICTKILECKISDRCIVVGIEGQGCSGKSTLSKDIMTLLIKEGYKADIISIDDFCNRREIRYSGGLESYKQHYYKNFDYEKFEREILKQVKENGKLEFHNNVLDVLQDTYTKRIDISLDSKSILIIEGIFIFRNEFKKYFDYKIMLLIDQDEQLKRALRRDLLKNGNLEKVINKYNERYIPAYEFYKGIDNPYEFVDLVINNNNINAPYIMHEISSL